MKVKLEYVWLDGYKPEPNLRSKIKIIDNKQNHNSLSIENIPEWGFDGSSTMQAEGYSSDCYLKPVRIYSSMIKNDEQYPLFYVLCEVYDKNNKAVDWYYRQVNPAHEKLVNKSKSEMIGQTAKTLFGTVEDY